MTSRKQFGILIALALGAMILSKNRKISLFSGVLLLLLTMPAYGGWDTSISKDEMTGDQSAYTGSPYTTPTKKMGFPYHDVRARLQVGCDSTGEWAYVF